MSICKVPRRLKTAAVAASLALTSLAGMAGAAPAATADVHADIVGGAPAMHPYSYVGSLQIPGYRGDPNWHTCGVTLITPPLPIGQFAVTNAHCVDNLPPVTLPAPANTAYKRFVAMASPYSGVNRRDPAIYQIRWGSTDRLAGGTVVKVSHIWIPKGWNWGVTDPADPEGFIYDFALLELSSPVWGPWAEIREPDFDKLTKALGWGWTTPNRTGPLPRQLQQLDMPLVDPAQCAAAGIGAGELCLGVPPGGGGPCNGDSGTAATQVADGFREVVIGSASRGADESVCGRGPLVYTDIHAFMPWALHTMVESAVGHPIGR